MRRKQLRNRFRLASVLSRALQPPSRRVGLAPNWRLLVLICPVPRPECDIAAYLL